MKRIALFGFIPALLIAALLVANNWRKQTPEYRLGRYPSTPLFDGVVFAHLNKEPPFSFSFFRCKGQMLFYSTWFETKKHQGAIQCILSTAAERLRTRQMTVTSLVSDTPQPKISLAPAQINLFKAISKTLPPSAATPPTLDNLLIVSFQQNGQWTTRLYDRSNLPASVVKAHQILGVKGFDKPPKSLH